MGGDEGEGESPPPQSSPLKGEGKWKKFVGEAVALATVEHRIRIKLTG